MKNEFTLAFNEVLEEKQLPKEVILKALESAMVSAYRRAVNASNAQHVEAKIEPDTGKVLIYAEKEVVEAVEDHRTEVSVAEARRYSADAEIGTMVVVETTPTDFGRVAAQTARQVIQQRIREAERQAQLTYYEKQIGEVISGVVQAVNAQGITIGMDMKAEGTMMRKEIIPGERFRVHDRVRSLVVEVKDGSRGPQIMLSRAHRNFLRRLLENEVPEIFHGVVEIRSIAREPGERAKVAVAATQQGIDPVGACVGIRGVRIQAIVRELHEEKIDVIEWNNDPSVYIAKAISPARVSGVYLNEKASGGKTATVVVPEDQLSLAIGRDGQNARLAAKLTGWRIDIKSVPEAAGDTLSRVKSDAALASVLAVEADHLPHLEAVLAKKSEGRALMPEEYDALTQFIDRVERRSASKRQAEKKAEDTRRVEARKSIAPAHFETAILDAGLPEHVEVILQEAGYATIGDLLLQMKLDPDSILALQGIGSKAMEEIKKYIQALEAAAAAAAAPVEVVQAPEAAAVETAVTAAAEQPAAAEAVLAEAAGGAAVVSVGEAEEEEDEDEDEEDETETEEGSELPMEQIFDLKPDLMVEPTEGTEESSDDDDKKDKKKKKKGRHVEVVYDPDRDLVISRKKHKRGAGWDETWE
jgi:N utilization substance protein A